MTRSDIVVAALAEMVKAHPPLGIDEIMRGPVMVVEPAPQSIIVVERDRVADAEILDRFADIGGVALEREFGRVDADHHQAVLGILLVPGPDVGDRAQAVDAAVGPEVDHHDLAAQALAGQRRRC